MRSVTALRSLCIAAALITGAAGASEHPFIADGYREAVFTVSNIESQIDFYEAVAGWQLLSRGDVPRDLLDAYGIAPAATATEAVLGNPGTERGFVRLVQFDGVAQRQIRSNAQSWDTGGFFDVNLRVVDMNKKFAELQTLDWQAASDPVEFSFGPFVVKEWLARGPDGIVLALIERVQPPLEGWPHLIEMSRFFNATQIVRDAKAARQFYEDQLGFELYLESTAASAEPEQNVLGLPHNFATEVPREVYILHPQGTNDGSVELLAFEGATGRDFADRVTPSNLGIFTLRFPLSDMSRFLSRVAAEKIELLVPETTIELAPYGPVSLAAIRGPGGVWLEFFEAL